MEDNGLIHLRSPYTVSETVKRLESALQAKGLNVFCAIDHSREAEKIGLRMRTTRLIIFGSPKAGTPLMVSSPTLAIDLPLKALIAEDDTGQVWLSYNSPEYLKQRHSIPDELVRNIAGVSGLLQGVVGSDSKQQSRSDAADQRNQVTRARRELSMKIGVIGAGQVGSACVLSLVLRGSVREIVLVNRDRKRADGVVTDIQYGAVLSPTVDIRTGDYADLAGASLVMITAGVNEKAGGATDRSDPAGRLRLLQANIAVYQEIVSQVHRAVPNALILVVTDPPDPLADVVRMSGHERVLSTGTYLDSLRFRFHLSKYLKVNPAYVEALVLGEHGTSATYLWSSTKVGGRPALESLAETNQELERIRQEIEQQVRYANITIIEGIGASQYGIAMVCARIAEMILRDERAVIPIGSYNPKYDVTLSLPSVVGREGVVEILEPDMTDAERQALHRSADTIKQWLERAHLTQRAPKAA